MTLHEGNETVINWRYYSFHHQLESDADNFKEQLQHCAVFKPGQNISALMSYSILSASPTAKLPIVCNPACKKKC